MGVLLKLHPVLISCLKLSAQRNETETKQFQNSFETVLKQFQNSFETVLFQFHFVVRTVLAMISPRIRSCTLTRGVK